MRAVRARVFALLAALLMLLPSGASARTHYYCQMMGRVVASCCCETNAVSQAPGAPQELQAADCCQRISASSRTASLGTREAFRAVAAAALPSTLPVNFGLSLPGDAPVSACSESTQAPLAIGPPLFVVH